MRTQSWPAALCRIGRVLWPHRLGLGRGRGECIGGSCGCSKQSTSSAKGRLTVEAARDLGLSFDSSGCGACHMFCSSLHAASAHEPAAVAIDALRRRQTKLCQRVVRHKYRAFSISAVKLTKRPPSLKSRWQKRRARPGPGRGGTDQTRSSGSVSSCDGRGGGQARGAPAERDHRVRAL